MIGWCLTIKGDGQWSLALIASALADTSVDPPLVHLETMKLLTRTTTVEVVMNLWMVLI